MTIPTFDEIREETHSLIRKITVYWEANTVYTFKWWILVAMIVIPWIVWIKWVDKKNAMEMFAYGLMIGVFALLLDAVGSNSFLWSYPVRLHPKLYPGIPYDFAAIPVPFMFSYQLSYSQPRKYFLYTLVTAAMLAFVAEPTMHWLNIYEPLKWKYIYSFIIYLSLAYMSKWIISKLRNY